MGPGMDYQTPLRDMRFLINDVLDFEGHFASIKSDASVELVDTILEQCGRFAENELFPLRASGDEAGCSWEDGVVTTPAGFAEAYATYVEGGWSSIAGNPAFGGQGLPRSISLWIEEIMASANMAWTMYGSLSRAAINAIDSHGSDDLKATFLPSLISGAWTGTMCLTEPHCGSDVGLLNTRAEPHADGSYRISGTKIFISSGEHDLADNIIHLVLARLPDSPAGTKGISLFVVPKKLEGEPNRVVCGAIEDKMGIHGNATCMLHFEESRGYLVGDANEGMRCMFTMMNEARILVGTQGVCLMELGYQASLQYATERLQMRSASGPQSPEKPADPILVHPDVRRMLLTQKAFLEGGRVMTYFAAQLADIEDRGDEEDRVSAGRLLDLITPIVKGFVTETGFEAVNHALQIYGGHGFIRETGIEQLVRDARITLIYEGTTQIQALDLLGRKVVMNQGKALMSFIEMIRAEADLQSDGPFAAKLRELADEWGELALGVGGKAAGDADEIGAASVDFLMYSGYVTLAYFWARIARIASSHEDDAFMRGKVKTARFFFDRLLPRANGHHRAALSGADSLMAVSENEFGHH